MSVAIIGIIGTIIGGIIAFLGVIVASKLQASREHKQWLRSKKEEAYSKSLRALLRLKDTRTKLTTNGTILLDVKDIKGWFEDYTESIPAFLTIIMMPLCFSIAEGIVFGFLSFIVLKVLTQKHKDVSLVMYIVGILFVVKFFIH